MANLTIEQLSSFTGTPQITDLIIIHDGNNAKKITYGELFNKIISGSTELQTDGSQFNLTGSIIPTSNATYDLGSPTKRWKDLYLSGSTIDLGGTLITRNPNGNIEFLDSGSLIQKSIELAAITGSVYVSQTVTVGEAMKLSPQHPLPSGETGMLAVSGSGGGPFGLHFYNGSTWLEISFV